MIEIPILLIRWPNSLVSEFSVIKLGLSVSATDPFSVGFYPIEPSISCRSTSETTEA